MLFVAHEAARLRCYVANAARFDPEAMEGAGEALCKAGEQMKHFAAQQKKARMAAQLSAV